MESKEGGIDLTGVERAEYGFPGPLRDRLVLAILNGEKTATSTLLAEYEREHEPLPQVGHLEVVLDSQGREVCVTRLVDVTVCALRDVTLDHVVAEGEGFASVTAWRKAHEDFWSSDEFVHGLGDPPLTINDDMRVICQRFRVIERLDPDIR